MLCGIARVSVACVLHQQHVGRYASWLEVRLLIKSRGVYELFRIAAKWRRSIKGFKEISMECSIPDN